MEQDEQIWTQMSVDKASPIPAYYQIKEYIKGLITGGQLTAGAQVPAERDLCSCYEVSRMTARQALSELVKEGYLYREKGRGTFVSPPKITHPMMSLVSFSEDMHLRGIRAGGKTLKKEVLPCHRKDILENLQVPEGALVLEIERLRYADQIPVVLERSYFRYEDFGMLEKEDLDTHSLYDLLQGKYHIYPHRSREMIEAGLSDGFLAELLHIAKGTPILVVTGVSFSKDGQAIEYVQSYYRGDRYKFHVELEREP